MPKFPKIAVLILAAGASKRFGAVKQLMPWNNSTILDSVLQTVKKLNLDYQFVVLGANSGLIQSKTDLNGFKVLMNNNWESGLGSSIAMSIKYIIDNDPDVEAVLFLLADQPLVNSNHLEIILAAFGKNKNRIIASEYDNGKKGVPAIFNKNYFKELSNLKGDKGAKAVIKKHNKNVVAISSVDKLFDIDTLEDYHKISQELKNKP